MTGLTFSEVMTGRVTLGEKDPWTGYRSSAAAGVIFTGTIEIDDMAAFLDDPEHSATLRAEFDAPRWGGGFGSLRGRFGLFTPTEHARTTRMEYEFVLTLDGRPRYLVGVKNVRVGGPWRIWPDTTTLLTTVHEGSDSSGAVIGAGVLRIRMPELLAMLGTMRGVGSSRRHRVGAVVRYLCFFAGGIVSTYVLRRRA